MKKYHKLSEAFWMGKRWMIFEPGIPFLSSPCFHSYGEAAKYCKEKELQGIMIRICDLGLILRILNGAIPIKNFRQFNIVKDSILNLPICSYFKDVDLVSSLSSGCYVPVIWKRLINPLSQINRFDFICDRLGEQISFETFPEAFAYFNIYFQYLRKSRKPPMIRMVGILENSTVVLYSAFNRSNNKEIIQERDPTQIYLLELTFFCKFNDRIRRICFYNGSLKRCSPFGLVENLEFRYFSREFLKK